MGKKQDEEEEKEIVRYNPDIKHGLTSEQVAERTAAGLDNKTKVVVGKSYWEIIRTDVFSFFNILLYAIAAIMIWAGFYSSLAFLAILIPNIIICLYEDIKARRLVTKLRIISAPHAKVIRDKEETQVPSSEVVLDDIIILSAGDQVVCDGTIVSGSAQVNESQITGESVPLNKEKGDEVLSGSYIISGKCYLHVEKVGKDTYIESVQGKANQFKRAHSVILKSLNRMFLVIGIIVIGILALTLILYGFQGSLSSVAAAKEAVGPLSASLVGMIPTGLYLTCSICIGVGTINLAKKQTLVQDMYSLEMLARVDVLCVDKTGTITDGNMKVKELIPFDNNKKHNLEQVISNILIATEDENDTANALREAYHLNLDGKIKTALPFTSDNKYSGASFTSGKSYFIGAPEYLDIEHKRKIINQLSEYTQKGFRVLVIAESSHAIKDGKAVGPLTALGAVILVDNVRENAPRTFQWFNENGVATKVISGDNALTVAAIAQEAGIEGADKYVSLDEYEDEDEIKALATQYTVFGRVKPEQKRYLIEGLQAAGHCVAMTGDGVNDILALKKADCSIAMADGAEVARNVSHLVLLDSDFDHLPEIVKEGRRSINNLQRTGSLFLSKTMFAMFFSILFLLISVILGNSSLRYPFLVNNMYLWEFLGIGLTGIVLSLEPSHEPIRPGFLRNIFRKAIPGGVMMILATSGIFAYGLLVMQQTGTFPLDLMRAMGAIEISILCLVILLVVIMPLTKFRMWVFIGAAVLDIAALLLVAFIWGDNPNNILGIHYELLAGTEYFIIGVIVVFFAFVYIFTNYVIHIVNQRKMEKLALKRTASEAEQTNALEGNATS